ncbi:hypothetical protein TPA0907_18610 [Micromonospora humidisoli]|nr:hypothetical protein TPA0907_18610 [Micromonospora sp. AKA109]
MHDAPAAGFPPPRRGAVQGADARHAAARGHRAGILPRISASTTARDHAVHPAQRQTPPGDEDRSIGGAQPEPVPAPAPAAVPGSGPRGVPGLRPHRPGRQPARRLPPGQNGPGQTAPPCRSAR